MGDICEVERVYCMRESVTYKKNLMLFTLYSLFSGKLFVATTQVLFFSFKGYSFVEIMLISSITEIVCLILELPSGILADALGNKKCMVVGMFFAVLANLTAIFAFDFRMAIVYAVLCSIQEAMLSGAENSYLFNMLSMHRKENEYKDVIRLINSRKMTFVAITTIFSGILFKINPYVPFAATTVFYIVAFGVTVVLEENSIEKKEAVRLLDYLRAIIDYLRVCGHTRWLVFLSMCYVFWFMNQNVLLQSYLSGINLPLELYGGVFFVLNIVSAGFAKAGKTIEKRLGKSTKAICTATMILCLVGAGIWHGFWALIFLACCRACIAIINPIMNYEINSSIQDNSTRATILSFYNASSSVLDSVASPMLGGYIDKAGIFSAYIVFGLSGLLPLIICLLPKRFASFLADGE